MVAWRLVDYAQADGAWQMAADSYFYRTIESHQEPVIVRLYSFIPPAISIGYHQTLEKVVDPQACAAAGIDVVRRPTGGRALLHRNEINYAVIADTARVPAFGKGLAEAFNIISRGIAHGLGELSIPVEITGRARHKPSPVGSPGAGLCAESATRFEVTSGQAKVAAAAQLRSAGKLLQHGTIYISETEVTPVGLFAGSARTVKPMMIDLSTLLGRHLQLKTVQEALARGFVGIFGPQCRAAGFQDLERKAIDDLAKKSAFPAKL